jgi:hypothetical protein
MGNRHRRGVSVRVLRNRIAAVSLAVASALPAWASPPSADFGAVEPSAEARQVGDWVVRTHDNRDLPFMVIDKRLARLYVFEAGGQLRGTSPVLLGLAKGDHTVPGIGDKPLAQVQEHERTTPAGRFVAERGQNLRGDKIIWVDYDSAVSMHRVRSVGPSERRLERLASPTPADNRISYGCINVPVEFFDGVIDRVVSGERAIVYVLPDVQPLPKVFGWTSASR